MSGGHWNYENDQAARAIFGWNMNVDYGNDGFSQSNMPGGAILWTIR